MLGALFVVLLPLSFVRFRIRHPDAISFERHCEKELEPKRKCLCSERQEAGDSAVNLSAQGGIDAHLYAPHNGDAGDLCPDQETKNHKLTHNRHETLAIIESSPAAITRAKVSLVQK
jgi:hypothetical protein